jgi:hypothetical protein
MSTRSSTTHRLVPLTHAARRPRPVHLGPRVQSVTRTIQMDHLLKKFGFLEFSASNVVFGPMQWGRT